MPTFYSFTRWRQFSLENLLPLPLLPGLLIAGRNPGHLELFNLRLLRCQTSSEEPGTLGHDIFEYFHRSRYPVTGINFDTGCYINDDTSDWASSDPHDAFLPPLPRRRMHDCSWCALREV